MTHTNTNYSITIPGVSKTYTFTGITSALGDTFDVTWFDQ